MGAGKAVTGTAKTIGETEFGKVSAQAVNQKLDQVGKSIDGLLENVCWLNLGRQELGAFKSKLADAIAFGRYRGSYLVRSLTNVC